MKRHITIIVSGKVQGVYFRASTKEKADELGVAGIVRNMPDGSVYIEAEGNANLLQEFTNWCQQGPPRAHVDHCNIKEGDLKNYSGFSVLR